MVIIPEKTQSFDIIRILIANNRKMRYGIKRLMCMIVASAATLAWTSCEKIGQDPDAKKEFTEKPLVLTRSEGEFVKGTNSFTFNLFKTALDSGHHDGKDIMISPLSVSFVLGALNNGAVGETSQEIVDVLGFSGGTTEDINVFCRKIMEGSGFVDNDVVVEMANAVMINKDYGLKEPFEEKMVTYYDAYIESLDFSDVDGVVKRVNDWCNTHSGGLIPRIIEKEEVLPSTVLYALNSIYFKGEWKNKFREEDTEKEVFTGINGSTMRVDMMSRNSDMQYFYTDTWSCVSLPYGNGSYSMYIILPDEGVDFNDFITSLDSDVWSNVLTTTGSFHDVRFKMPKLDVECSFDLIDMMKELGVRKAFSSDAEFTEMCDNVRQNLYLGLLKQKSRIIVDESGTKAAAVTIGGMLGTMAPPSEDQPIIFHADRPFVYIIQENHTGTIYFIGAKLRP